MECGGTLSTSSLLPTSAAALFDERQLTLRTLRARKPVVLPRDRPGLVPPAARSPPIASSPFRNGPSDLRPARTFSGGARSHHYPPLSTTSFGFLGEPSDSTVGVRRRAVRSSARLSGKTASFGLSLQAGSLAEHGHLTGPAAAAFADFLFRPVTCRGKEERADESGLLASSFSFFSLPLNRKR